MRSGRGRGRGGGRARAIGIVRGSGSARGGGIYRGRYQGRAQGLHYCLCNQMYRNYQSYYPYPCTNLQSVFDMLESL